MGINYKFNTWRITGERAEALSPIAYRLLNMNVGSDTLNGFKVGQVLYQHHVSGMTAQEIKNSPVGYGISVNTIRSILRGFSSQSGVESFEAYDIAMYMIQNEVEILEQMFKVTEYTK